jgi:hypothetical protein
MLLAAGYCFVSGADSAIIYEHTEQGQGKQEFIRTEGSGGSAGMFSEAATSFIGGSFLVLVSLRFPLYFDILLALAVIPVALMLHESEKPKKQKRESIIRKMVRLMKHSLHDHVEIKWLMIYSAIVSSSTLMMVWLTQAYWAEAQIPKMMFGGLWATMLCVGAGVSYYAHAIEEKLGRKTSLILLAILPVTAYLLLGLHIAFWSITFIPLFYVTRGMNNPIMKSYINGLVSSEERASILSVQSLMGRLIFAVSGPIVGQIADAYSLQTALVTCGVFFAALSGIAIIFLHKNRLM